MRSVGAVVGWSAAALFVVASVAASELESTSVADMSERRIERPLGAKEVRVELASANIGDCKADAKAPAAPAENRKASAPAEDRIEAEGVAAKRAPDCDNSIQISIRAGDKAKASKVRLKSVQLYDDGKLIGTLAAKTPKAWDGSGEYKAWDEKVAPGKTLSASYEIAEPDWTKVEDRKNKSFRIRVSLTVGGAEQQMEEDIAIDADISLPPDVVT